MTASPGREVDANLLRGAALRGAQTRADPQDAGGQDLSDLVEALGGGHQVWIQGLGHGGAIGKCFSPDHLPTGAPKRRAAGTACCDVGDPGLSEVNLGACRRGARGRHGDACQSPIPAKRENASNEGARRSAS